MTVRLSGRWSLIPADARRRVVLVACAACILAASTVLHLVVLAEGPHWRSPLLAGEWLFNVVLAVTILAYASALGRRVFGALARLDGDGLADRLATLGLGLGIMSSLVLLVGFARLYYGAVFLAAFLGLTALLRDQLVDMLDGVARAVASWRRERAFSIPDRRHAVVLLLLGVTLVHVAARSMRPLDDWDALAYHMSSVKIYLAHHSIVPLPDIPLANAPSSEEMLFLPGLMAGSDGLGKVLNIAFGVLLALSVFALARRLRGRIEAWQAALFLATSIWIIQVLPDTFTDFSSAFFLVTAVYDVSVWTDNLAHRGRQPARGLGASRLLLRAGLFTGLSASCKLSTLPALPALCCAVAICGALYAGPALGRKIRVAIQAGSIMGTAALVPLSPWLLKNLYFFRAPLYPYEGVSVSNPTSSNGLFVQSTAASPLAHAHWIITSLADFLINDVGLLSVLLLVSIFVLKRPVQRAALVSAAALIALWFLFVPYFAPPRYYLGVAGVTQALSVTVAYELWEVLKFSRSSLQMLLLLYLLLRAVYLAVAEYSLLSSPMLGQVATGQISRYDYLSLQVRGYQAEMWINAHTPEDARIAVVNVITGYYLDRSYLNDWYGSRRAQLMSGEAPLREQLALWCRHGVRYVVFDRGDGRPEQEGLDNGARQLDSFAWTRTPHLDVQGLFSARGVDVLAVRPCDIGP